MEKPWLHRYAILLAVCTLLLVAAGASVTSNQAGLSVPDWPLSYGKVMPEMKGGVFYEPGHRMLATLVGFLTVIMAIWLWRADERRWMRNLGLAALAAVILQGVLGGMTVIFMLPKPVSISHACLAQLFFSTTLAIALFTSPAWKRGARPVDEAAEPQLRWLAIAAPVSVLGQVALGAAARHKALGIVPHVAGALLATGVILWVTLRILMRYSEQPALRASALTLLGVTFVQVFLGIAAYMSRLVTADAVQPMPVMVTFTVLHVAAGALTMAASVVLAI